ncbi:hypothetical protein [Streptomyces cavernae]|uniref:hypothetical protein n=1 Tax=Streptomyces cavernae TaxID=2259034 RepID=UPI00192E66DD|nr:hypothetical protein [Streptomyces cavernae]
MVLGSDLRRNGRRGNRRRVAGLLAAAVLVLGGGLAGCGDDSGGGDNTTPPTPTVETPTPTTQPSPTTPQDTAAAEKQIRTNWQKFFDPDVPLKDKAALLENGDKLGPLLESFSDDPRGGQVEAVVDRVEFTSPTEANVTYALTLKGATVLPGATGTAVLQDDTWKVSVKTLCGLVGMSGNGTPAPGC